MNDDTISRRVAIDALESIGSIDTEADKEYARSVFEALPSTQSGSAEKDIRAMCGECDAWNIYKNYLSAQPERKRGEWIQNDNSTYSCSLCHSWIPEEQYYYAQFCLYCGADMRGEEWECDSVNKLRSLPSAETEDRPTGEWVFDTQIPIGKGAYSAGYRCSKCGKDYFRVDGMNFCPNCGADMRGEEDDEWDGGYSRSREEIITLKLRMLPSSNKSGHWVMNPSEVAGDGYYICSNCNNDVYDATDFCPNCGSYNGGRQSD